MVVKTQKLCFCQFQMTIMQQVYMIKLICVPNVVYYCKWFTISVLINPFCDSGAAKYRCQTGSLIFLAVFNKHLEKNYCSDIKFFPQPLISTTMTRCPANFMNLSAIIVELSLAEYDRKLGRYLQMGLPQTSLKFRQKKNTENIAAKLCTACPNTLIDILWKFYQNLRWSSWKHLLN